MDDRHREGPLPANDNQPRKMRIVFAETDDAEARARVEELLARLLLKAPANDVGEALADEGE